MYMYLSCPCQFLMTILYTRNLINTVSRWFYHNFHQPELPYINWSKGASDVILQSLQINWGSIPQILVFLHNTTLLPCSPYSGILGLSPTLNNSLGQVASCRRPFISCTPLPPPRVFVACNTTQGRGGEAWWLNRGDHTPLPCNNHCSPVSFPDTIWVFRWSLGMGLQIIIEPYFFRDNFLQHAVRTWERKAWCKTPILNLIAQPQVKLWVLCIHVYAVQ